MRYLTIAEIKEKSELVKEHLKQWSIHMSLRLADVPYKYHPKVRKLLKKELKAYNERARKKYKKIQD